MRDALIDEAMISKAALAIESEEPSPKEHEDMLLARLIPGIRMALDRGDSVERIRSRLKSVMPNLHHSKIKKLFKAAESFHSKQLQSEHAQ